MRPKILLFRSANALEENPGSFPGYLHCSKTDSEIRFENEINMSARVNIIFVEVGRVYLLTSIP